METTISFKLSIHPSAVKICRTLQTMGYQAYIVGGCVRDLHLDMAPKDWDITTSATPEQVTQLFERTLPTGLQHGTVTVCMGEGVENHFEVTTFRTEGKYLDGRRPEEVKFISDLKEDLARRDFTINAMAYDPITNTLIDPFNGREDLASGIIRAVGDANVRFQEDGLRIMRAARFAARFGYQIEENTFAGMKNNLETLKKVSKERIKDELCKTIMAPQAGTGLYYLYLCDVFVIACPFFKTISATNLLHDTYCGELETRLAYLFRHSFSSVENLKKDLLACKLSHKEVERICFLLDALDRSFAARLYSGNGAYSKFIAHFKNHAPDAWEHTLAQFIELERACKTPIDAWLEYHKKTVVFARKELAINGDDLLSMGVPQGPELKRLLDVCYQEILERPENNNKKYLLAFISENN